MHQPCTAVNLVLVNSMHFRRTFKQFSFNSSLHAWRCCEQSSADLNTCALIRLRLGLQTLNVRKCTQLWDKRTV